ncbi:Asparagine synthase [Candidatus Bilamarchaeum dharawalense]|uniref:Asparagine synthase n=1 Tax=Candidatus Bilamarchaeum dharawalense TaxID=2885759 RepID=A0A5E4LPR2_9ARCH|nr:Asparagine synthase [Candidatus Bilamarchaeum dharawalense]
MILELTELLSRAVEEKLEDRLAIAFSAGLDSTVIAAIAKKHVHVELFTVGVKDSEDMECSERVAGEMGLPLIPVYLDEKIATNAYEKCYDMLKLDFHRLEIMVPVYCVAEAAAQKGHRVLLFGTAAEELFVGYERYYQYKNEGKDLDSLLKEEYKTLPQREIAWTKKLCNKFDIESRFPLYNKELAELMFSVPLDERMHDRELKKGILREAGKILKVPECVLKRRKKAMQYGSGVHKILLRKRAELDRLYPKEEPNGG